mmetsp:Transcript_1140/g.1992  ORF Transcript_1140/g.1992 Transcript_1140/m.1992 type:complete len:302 (-) Transcript_1140:202-1107(-)
MMQPSIYGSLSNNASAAAESLNVMMHKEQSIYKICDYLRPSWPADDIMVTEHDRLKIVDWCYSVVDQCQFDRETVAMAMGMVDRFLSKQSNITQDALRDRKQFQLVAMAALYISIKCNEKVALGSGFFSALSHDVYTAEEIEAMEMSILQGLSWRICAPTSIQMAHYILSLTLPHVNLKVSTWGFILDEVRFQTECAVREYCLATERPSTVALAAIFNTLEQVNRQDRQDILHALLFILNRKFAPPDILEAAKEKLHRSIGANGTASDEVTIVPTAGACSVKSVPSKESFDHEKNPKMLQC